MTHWPDGTPKSTNNAFDWRSCSPSIKPPKPMPVAPRSKNLHAKSNVFQTYTRAHAATGNFPPVAISRGERSETAATAQA